MHACMHACMYVCMHACMHVCIYIYIGFYDLPIPLGAQYSIFELTPTLPCFGHRYCPCAASHFPSQAKTEQSINKLIITIINTVNAI